MAALSIDELLLPGLMGLNVSQCFEQISAMSRDMGEYEVFFRRLLSRLMSLRDETQANRQLLTMDRTVRLASTVGRLYQLLRKHSSKNLLERIAAHAALLAAMRELHEEIDQLSTKDELSDVAETTQWKQSWDDDIATRDNLLRELMLSNSIQMLIIDKGESTLHESLVELQYEMAHEEQPPSPAFVALREKAFAAVVQYSALNGPEPIPQWYMRRSDVDIREEIDTGYVGVTYRGVWKQAKIQVAIKCLYTDSKEAQASFLKEMEIWSRFTHDHVLKLHGACHVGKPLFFVSELANSGDFVKVFGRSFENTYLFWRLFYQAAQGLSYIHSKHVIHGNLKCKNILVGNDGNAKICDFGFSHIRALEVGKSIKETSDTVRWKAPECLLEQGYAANPTFKSDVYSLGMSIVEAKTGDVPWGMLSDEDIIDQIASEEGHPRPDGFTDKEWALVQGMIEFEATERKTLDEAIAELAELAVEEEEQSSTSLGGIRCGSCGAACATCQRFCSECGLVLDPLTIGLGNEIEPELETDPATPAQHKESSPRAKIDSPQQEDRNSDSIGGDGFPMGAEQASASLARASKEETIESAVKVLDDRAALLNRIKLLEMQLGVKNYPGYEEPSGRFCNNCGDLNPLENIFCCECGNDIEVARRIKL